MPPKKKLVSAGKKKSKDASVSQEALEASEQLVQANGEVETLSRELAIQGDLNDRLKQQIERQRVRITDLEERLERKFKDGLDLASDMGRQYKSMQADMASRIGALEQQVLDLNTKLEAAHATIKDMAKEHERATMEKDTMIEDQQVKMSYMSTEFETMLNETLAKMAKKLESVSQRWKDSDNIHLSDVNQRRLADFHLTRLTLGKSDE
ncbi:hypothetical protein BC832DRAFT_553576 [Gaertneriomyces semiglobifer]|nr:hypothetical protein BC832DRAFT_553576 [Gaertneriomyces semiglobifer]